MNILRKILLPASLLYSGIIRTRNLLYDKNVLESRGYDFPVICVGNLSVGGTGKSPMIEYLLKMLLEQKRVATLSRGYGRKTSGFILLNGTESPQEVGDEPLQFKLKFPGAIVAVDEKRQRGISRLSSKEAPEVILLDDAFQHRKVRAGLNILLTSYGNIYNNDYMLPTGNLREPTGGAKRAAIIVVTKCPWNLSVEEQEKIKRNLGLKRGQQLFFSSIKYSDAFISANAKVPLGEFKEPFTLVTGIANARPLVQHLEEKNFTFSHISFPDHHNFTSKELDLISKAPCVVTTEKDYMRLKDSLPPSKLFYLPIEVGFLNKEREFQKAVYKFAT